VKDTIRQFIVNGGDFEATALALYAWQRANNPEYDRFCGEIDVGHWSQIPAPPTTLFRDLSFTCFDPQSAKIIFKTSGTTSARQGVVRLQDTEIYDLSARRQVHRCLGALPKRGVGLVPTAKDSSLGHMCRLFLPDMPSYFDGQTGVDRQGAWAAITKASSEGQALFIPGTAFALADLLDHPIQPVVLAPGSVVMVTGGFKGRARTVPQHILYNALSTRLLGASIVGEYGMSELGSQLWSVPATGPFRPPPWMRVLAVDPWTGAPATRGLLRFYDLANHQTVLAIETQDMGVVHPDGSVRLEGRLQGATPRGCSLRAEETHA
jgi:acyl-CoA synthetase (AMP-forming)/AMP-acid ligase II